MFIDRLVRQLPLAVSFAVPFVLFAAGPASATGDETFPEHVRQALDGYDEAARLIVESRYDQGVTALEGLGKTLPPPYAAKAAAAGRKLLETVVKPRFDARSSYHRSRQRTLAAEVCLQLHAYPEAAEILEEVVRDGIVTVRDDRKLDVVRRAYRHAGADAARYQDLFDRCRDVDREIYSRDLLERDQESAVRRRSGETLAELVDELPAELPRLGLEEFHWLRMRKLCDAWPQLASRRDRAELLLGESARRIGDQELADASPDGTSADRSSSEPVRGAEESRPRSTEVDLLAAATVRRLLESGRVDSAAGLARGLIQTAQNEEACFSAVLETADVLSESGRYDQALELFGGLVLAPQFSSADGKHRSAVAAYRCAIRKGDPQEGLRWARMAVEHFRRSSFCGTCLDSMHRADEYLLAEARLRADPSDAHIDAGFDTLIKYGLFEGSIGGLIAAEYARRGKLDTLDRRIDRLAELDAAGKLPVDKQALSIRHRASDQVVPGLRMQIRLERARSLGQWEPLWEHLVIEGRRVHEALRLLPDSGVELPNHGARQSAALLLDRPKETLRNLGKVRNIDDLKLGWKLYFTAALRRPGVAQDIRARFDTIVATPDAHFSENYLDCMTALSALPENERRELLEEIRSARYQLERKHENDPGFRPVSLDRFEVVRRPRFLEE